LTDEMRQQAYTELNQNIASQAYPYRIPNRTLWVEGKPVFRTNHNGSNMLRQVKHTEDFLKQLQALKTPTDYSKILEGNPQIVQEIKLGAYFASLGRLTEGSWKTVAIDTEEYGPTTITAYNSAIIFKEMAKDIGLEDSEFTGHIALALCKLSDFAWADDLIKKIDQAESPEEKDKLQKLYLVWALITGSHGNDHVRTFTQEEMKHDYTELENHFLKRCCGLEGQDVADSVEHYKATSTKYCLLTGQNIKGGEGQYKRVKFHPELFYNCSTNTNYCYERLKLDI